MANWTISPCGEGVATPCSCDDGKFLISPNVPNGTNFTLTYKSGDTTKTINYTKETECITCECSDVIFDFYHHFDSKGRRINDVYFNVSAHMNVELGIVTFKEGTNCSQSVSVSGSTGSTGFTDIKIVGDKVVASFPAYTQTFDATGRKLEFRFVVNGTPCTKRYEIYQQAWKGTDNGMDYFANGFMLDYPIQLCACGDPTDGDSIVAENGAWYYDPVEDSFTKLEKNAFEAKYPNGVVIDGWCRFTASEVPKGLCDVGMINIEALSENPSSTEIRKASIILSSVNSKTASPVNISSIAPAGWHPGEQCALKWTYDVWQLPRGYSNLYKDDGLTFQLITNEELAECMNNHTCDDFKKEDCRGSGYNCK